MHTLSAWFTRNPVAANLLMVLILVGGAVTLQSIRIEAFPALPLNSVQITTVYPGAGVAQVDQGVSRKIEKALEGMPGVKKISSFSDADLSTVWVQKVSRFDMNRFENQIKTRIDALDTLPQRAERPRVSRDEFKLEALLVQVYGDTDRATLQKVARLIKAALLAHPKIANLKPFGLLPYEMRIEVDDDKMRTFGVTLEDVVEAINAASMDYPTGNLRSEAGRVIIRADHKAQSYRDFTSIPVMSLADGSRVRIQDIATVSDGFSEEIFCARFQRQPSVGMQVYTSQKGHLPEVSQAAHDVVDTIRPQLPDSIQVDIWGESSTYIKARLSLLATNAWQGLLIVFVLLALFLNFKLAAWVAVGIPISLAGTLTLMGDRFFGRSLNDLTTFGMIIVLGILVDDAIVVGESVFEARSRVGDPVEGTIQGVRRVSTATVFGCFTTVAAFFPLLLIDNEMGKIFASFALVVVIALLVSLLESKLILPAHLAAVRIDGASTPSPGLLGAYWRRLQTIATGLLAGINQKCYQPILGHCLRHRATSLLIFTTIAACTIGWVFNGWIRTVFFPDVPGQIISVELEMKSGSPMNLTTTNVSAVETAAEAVNQQVMAELGTDAPPIARLMTAITGPMSAVIFAELQPEEDQRLDSAETLARWRERVATLEGIEKLSFNGSLESGGGFVVEVGAREEKVLEDAVQRLTAALAGVDGVGDINDDLQQGSPQIRLRLKPEAQHLGLTNADLASQIGDAFGGREIQRVQRGGDEVKVMVKYKAERRRYMQDLLDTHIRTRRGEWLPLAAVASIETGYVPTALKRQNGRRVVQVRASLDKAQISAAEAFTWIQANVAPEIEALYPQVSISGGGELAEMNEMQGGLKRALIVILILIYALLAVPLKSYWQPLVIMAVIPFGFVGAAMGHWVMGSPLSVISFFGALALMGVVVNDSLVLMTRFNAVHRKGTPLKQALVTAGTSRFRAIVLTTATTVCGLMPLLSETSEQAQYLIPAAISLAWGELFATPITLIIVPILIHMGHDARVMAKRLKGQFFEETYNAHPIREE